MDVRINDNPSPDAHAEGEDGTGPAVEIKPDLEKLRTYTQTKLALVDQLRIVREALTALGRENGQRQCEELVVKLAEDRFTLAVLGLFKRGKSSLMNAVIGRDLLPTGMLPLTSAITVLKYGPTERLVVHHEDSIFPKELPVSALADYVTERGNPANRKKVKTACVESPVPFLRRGVEFVDTPGVGSAIAANTATTYGFLPECDAVLFVTSVDMPMTSMELEFLKEIREYVDKIFFVVNKIDLVDDGDRSAILEFVAGTIRSQIGRDVVNIFSVSARMGLAAKTSGDAVLYERSGLKALEEALASFLSEEKSDAFLSVVAHKALRVLDEEAALGAFGETALRDRTKAMQKKEFVGVRRDPRAAAAAVTEAQSKLEALHESILKGRMAEAASTESLAIIAAQVGSAAGISVAASVPTAANMEADLQTRGCPVCRHIAKHAAHFFAHWQYQIGTEERSQAEFAAELGFCPLHTWQLIAVSSPHGASVGFARLVEEIAHRLRESTAASAMGNVVRRLVRDSQNCRVCELIHRVEADYIVRLVALIGEAAGLSQYHRSQGVCLRHLGMLVDTASTLGRREFLMSHAVQRLEEDLEDMRSFALKHEARRRALQNRNEEDAYRRAIIRIVGERSVCMPWSEDGEI